MSETGPSAKQSPVTELKVTAHLMTLEPGVVDGSQVGPVDQDQAAEAESLAPLEAFQVIITEIAGAAAQPAATPTMAPAAPAAVPSEPKPLRRVASSVPAKPIPAKPGRRPLVPAIGAKPKSKRR